MALLQQKHIGFPMCDVYRAALSPIISAANQSIDSDNRLIERGGDLLTPMPTDKLHNHRRNARPSRFSAIEIESKSPIGRAALALPIFRSDKTSFKFNNCIYFVSHFRSYVQIKQFSYKYVTKQIYISISLPFKHHISHELMNV